MPHINNNKKWTNMVIMLHIIARDKMVHIQCTYRGDSVGISCETIDTQYGIHKKMPFQRA